MDRVERVRCEEMWLTVATEAIRLRHPQADWIARHSTGRPVPLTDAALEAAVERVGVWLSEQPPLPVHPDSYLARKGD